jgi:hypothetical protein
MEKKLEEIKNLISEIDIKLKELKEEVELEEAKKNSSLDKYVVIEGNLLSNISLINITKSNYILNYKDLNFLSFDKNTDPVVSKVPLFQIGIFEDLNRSIHRITRIKLERYEKDVEWYGIKINSKVVDIRREIN